LAGRGIIFGMEKYSLAEINLDGLENDPDSLLKKLLHLRGIKDGPEIEKFLNPDYEEHLHNPFLLNDLDKAVQRISTAVKNNEKVVIYSDYDADGIPGAVMLHDFFKEIGFNNFENHIPHRHNDGFGLHLEAVESFAEKKVNLIITIDCGTADTAQVQKAHEFGIDVIITDHHEVNSSGLPEGALSVINPKRPDSTYPFLHLCGAAVVYKLIQGLIERGGFEWKKGQEKWFLDMAGLATLSDMVPLVGENRVLAYYGILVLRKSRRPGLRKMFEKLRIEQRHLSEDDITFMITPRINAASRMGSALDAFGLLSTKNFKEAEEATIRLNEINNERKGAVALISKEIKQHIFKNDAILSGRSLVIGNPKWRPALLGLVANNLVEEFKKPVFLWGRDGEEVIKGSCRSDGKINILSILEETRDCFLEFGGHKMAGGFSVIFEKIHTLPEKISLACETVSSVKDFQPEKIIIDEKLDIKDANQTTFEIIKKLAPFGVGNPKPIFLIEKIEIKSLKEFGKQGKHFEIKFIGTDVRAIYFFAPKEKIKFLNEGEKANLIVSLEESFFLGRPEFRLRIVDVFN